MKELNVVPVHTGIIYSQTQYSSQYIYIVIIDIYRYSHIVILMGIELTCGHRMVSPYLWRRQVVRIQISEGLSEQLLSQDGSQVSSHYCLLLHRAVVLQGQDQRVGRCLGGRKGLFPAEERTRKSSFQCTYNSYTIWILEVYHLCPDKLIKLINLESLHVLTYDNYLYRVSLHECDQGKKNVY